MLISCCELFPKRCFSTSVCQLTRNGKKGVPIIIRPVPRRSLTPFDKRLPVTSKHAKPHMKGGSYAAMRKLAKHDVPKYGYTDPRTGNFVPVKEMIPEFIVPDLKDFKLKPYVPFDSPDVIQSAFTAKKLFQACYSDVIIKKLKEGKSKEEILKEFSKKNESSNSTK